MDTASFYGTSTIYNFCLPPSASSPGSCSYSDSYSFYNFRLLSLAPALTTTIVESVESQIGAKARLRQPSQQESAKKANLPQFKHIGSGAWTGSGKYILVWNELSSDYTVLYSPTFDYGLPAHASTPIPTTVPLYAPAFSLSASGPSTTTLQLLALASLFNER